MPNGKNSAANVDAFESLDILFVVKNYDDLREAMRARMTELGLTCHTAEALAGLASGHVGKITGPSAVRKLGIVSLGLMLETLSMKMVLVGDPEAYDRMRDRYPSAAEGKTRRAIMQQATTVSSSIHCAKVSEAKRNNVRRTRRTLSPAERRIIHQRAAQAQKWNCRAKRDSR